MEVIRRMLLDGWRRRMACMDAVESVMMAMVGALRLSDLSNARLIADSSVCVDELPEETLQHSWCVGDQIAAPAVPVVKSTDPSVKIWLAEASDGCWKR